MAPLRRGKILTKAFYYGKELFQQGDELQGIIKNEINDSKDSRSVEPLKIECQMKHHAKASLVISESACHQSDQFKITGCQLRSFFKTHQEDLTDS